MEDDEDDEGPFEEFGIHRLELAPGTKSGYVGVRPNPSKKRPWQAWARGCRWEGSGRRSATLRSLRMPRWPGQRQRLKAFVIFAARESRLSAIRVPLRAASRP